MSHAPAFVPAEHGDRIIGCNANEGDIARFLRAIQRDREAVTVDNRRRRRALKHCVRSFHGQPGALSWLAKTEVSMSTLPSIRCTPAFFQRRHHIANILPFKRRIAAEACNQVAFQHAAVKGTFGFQRGGKAKIGPQLQQCRQRGDDLCVLAGSAICWL